MFLPSTITLKNINKIYTPKTWSKDRGRQQQDISSYLHSVFKGTLKFFGVSRHTVIKAQNTFDTTQLASSIVFKCFFPKPNKIRNKSFIMPSL